MNIICRHNPVLYFFVVFLACFVRIGTPAQASEWESYNRKDYGDCIAEDMVNLLTDQVYHQLSCYESSYGTITTFIDFNFYPETSRETIWLAAEYQYISGYVVEIAIRVDSGQLRRGRWSPSKSGFAYRSGVSWSESLLSEMALGNRVTFRVGDQSASIPLKGSAAAISDYKSRIAQYNQ